MAGLDHKVMDDAKYFLKKKQTNNLKKIIANSGNLHRIFSGLLIIGQELGGSTLVHKATVFLPIKITYVCGLCVYSKENTIKINLF